jgi:hypothetical protein
MNTGNLWYTRPVTVSHTLYTQLYPARLFNSQSTKITLKLGLHGVPQPLVVEESLDATNSADGNILVPELAVCEVHDIGLRDGVDLALDLARLHAAAGGDQLTANILSDSSCPIERQQDGSLQLSLGALNLGLGDVGTQTHPLTNGEVDEVVNAGKLVGAKVDTPKTAEVIMLVNSVVLVAKIIESKCENVPGVAVAGRETHETVGDIVLVNVTAELAALMRSVAHGLVVVADDSLSDESRKVVIGVPAYTLDGQSNVGSAHSIVTNSNIGADELSLLLGKLVGVILGALAGKTREVLLSELNKLLVGDTPGTNEYHAVGRVIVLDVVGEFRTGDIADVLARAKNGAAQSLVLESSSVKMVEDHLLDLLLDLLRLPQDNVALTLDGRLGKLRILQNVGKDIDELRNIGVESLGVVDSVLALLDISSGSRNIRMVVY